MKLVNWEFRRDVSLWKDQLFARGVWVVEFDGLMPLIFQQTEKLTDWGFDATKIRNGVKANVGVYKYWFRSLDLIDVGGENVRPFGFLTFRSSPVSMKVSDFQFQLLGGGQVSSSSWTSEMGALMNEIQNGLLSCDELLEFLVSPARWYEAEQGRLCAKKDHLQLLMDQEEAKRKKVEERGKKFNCQLVL